MNYIDAKNLVDLCLKNHILSFAQVKQTDGSIVEDRNFIPIIRQDTNGFEPVGTNSSWHLIPTERVYQIIMEDKKGQVRLTKALNNAGVEIPNKIQDNLKMNYKLTQKGYNEVLSFIADCKSKRKEILDAGKDTADDTQLPTVEAILSEIGWYEDDSEYYNGWGVTDNYNMDYPIYLEKSEDYIEVEPYIASSEKDMIVADIEISQEER